VANGIVYVGSNDEKLYAFDAGTGAVKWSATTDGAIASSPVVSNGTVYVGSHDKSLYAFDAASGSLKWRTPTNGSIDVSSPIVLTFNGNIVRPGISGDVQ
jgi:outer membrane protein assembly factor BamB